MRDKLLKIVERIEPNYHGDYKKDDFSQLSRYVDKRLSKRYAQDIIDNLDIIIKYVNNKNMHIVCNEVITNHPDFIKQFIKYLGNFRYPKKLSQFIFEVGYSIPPEELYTDELIDKVISLNADEETISEIIDSSPKERKYGFVKKCIDVNIVPVHMYPSSFSPEIIELLKQNLERLLPYCNDYFQLRYIFYRDEEATRIINKYMNEHFDGVVDSIMINLDEAISDNKYLRDFVYFLVKDVVDNEQVRLSDISVNPGGRHSRIIFIGDKVIKIGLTRDTKHFPNIPYIIKPLLREEMRFGNNDVFMEVMEQAEVNFMVNDEEKIIYELYKKVRDLGLIWTDGTIDNVGMLKRDNEIYWREDIDPSDETLSFTGRRGTAKLKAGDYVILDADDIYDENDPALENYTSRMEDRYQDEKRKEKRGL